MKFFLPFRRIAPLALVSATALHAQSSAISPAQFPRVATVSPRFQGYNIEMVEVTGGRFWSPYKDIGKPQANDASRVSVPAGMDPSLYRYRPPIDLGNAKLRRLATALGPAYVRVSGTWANSTYFHDSDTPAPKTPPAGFGSVLTRQQWKGVLEFVQATGSELVSSFAVSGGVRDANGVWTPVEARKVLDFTRANGGSIAAAEMFNEPTFASIGGAPKGYDGAAYGRDFKAFHAFVAQAAPKMIVLGPGSIGEPGMNTPLLTLRTPDMMTASGPGVEAFSYHFYGGASQRCVRPGTPPQATLDTALTDDWLSMTNRDEAFYAKMRDQYTPGKPLWLTETAETACGGDPWASTFVDSFRYLNQLGALAKRNVQVVLHNTLAASDYALLDEDTYDPRPNYWAALLWHRLMGTTVLDADPTAAASGTPSTEGLYLYAHCLAGKPGGVALLAINASKETSRTVTLPQTAERYTLSADSLTATTVELNGAALNLAPDGTLPKITGTLTKAGEQTLAPKTITFFALAKAGNVACR